MILILQQHKTPNTKVLFKIINQYLIYLLLPLKKLQNFEIVKFMVSCFGKILKKDLLHKIKLNFNCIYILINFSM